MTTNMPAIIKKVREMRKDKAQRIADTCPQSHAGADAGRCEGDGEPVKLQVPPCYNSFHTADLN
jgi:hypothetical protein